MLVHEMEEIIKEMRSDFKKALDTEEVRKMLKSIANLITNDFEEKVIVENLKEVFLEWLEEQKEAE